MEIALILVIFILLIGLKLGVLLYILNKDKKKQNPPKDENILDNI